MAEKSKETKVAEVGKGFAEYQELVGRFVGLANQMKDEGKAPPTVNAALMLASGFYATYMAVGNDGKLDAKGVNQVAEVYRKNLSSVQRLKEHSAAQRRSAEQGGN